MPLTQEFGFKSRNLGGFLPGSEVSKTILRPRQPRLRIIPDNRPLSELKLDRCLITCFIVLVFYWTDTALNEWYRAFLLVISIIFLSDRADKHLLKVPFDLGEIS